MGVGDQSPGYWTPRINPSFCGSAIQPFRRAFDQAPLLIAANSLEAPYLERVAPFAMKLLAAALFVSALAVPSSALAQKKIPKAQGHNQCPLGYVNTLGTTCLSPIYYEMKPTNGEACPSGWMNVGAGYCRKK